MIRAASGTDAPLTFHASAEGVKVYLDNFALLEFAKGDSSRRQRLVTAFRRGANLLFSVGNAAELSGPQGASSAALRTFLDELGPHWYPVELNPVEVVERELRGAPEAESCLSEDFFRQYFVTRTSCYEPSSGRIIDLSEQFYSLGAVIDWLVPQRESLRKANAGLDAALISKIGEYRVEFDRDPQSLDRAFPVLAFNSSKPATFAYVSLARTLVLEAKAYKFMKGDGTDFCHAVMASAFSNFGTLDKQWKRRVEGLPQPNGLARIYYEPELNQMVDDIESAVAQVIAT